jgi:hypothetical protein
MNLEQNHAALRHWVTQSTRSNRLEGNALTIEQRVQNILNRRPPLKSEILVYRGHSADAPKIFPTSWFSTSSDVVKVRRQHIADRATCCLFKLHILPGIRVMYVDSTIKKAGLENTKYNESEIIVNGKGYFYTDESLTKEGFREIEPYNGVTQYEAWYSTKVPIVAPKPTTNTILKKINTITPDMFEFIDTPDNLVAFNYVNSNNLMETNTQTIKARINARKVGIEAAAAAAAKNPTTGGRRKTRKLYRKSRKSRKART